MTVPVQHPLIIPTKEDGTPAIGRFESFVLRVGQFWWKITGWLTLPFLISTFYTISVPLLVVADFTTAPDRNLGLRFLADQGLFGLIVVPKWFIYVSFISAGLTVRQNINVVWLTMTLFPMLLYALGLLSLAMTGSPGGALVTVYLIFGGLAGIVGLRTRWEVAVTNIEYLRLRHETDVIRKELEIFKSWRDVLSSSMSHIDVALTDIESNNINTAVKRLSQIKKSITGAIEYDTDTDADDNTSTVADTIHHSDQ